MTAPEEKAAIHHRDTAAGIAHVIGDDLASALNGSHPGTVFYVGRSYDYGKEVVVVLLPPGDGIAERVQDFIKKQLAAEQ